MRLDWFMHAHGGRNTLVGVLPTPAGTFVRSWVDGTIEVTWYPMGTRYPGGDSRQATSIHRTTGVDEDSLENAVVDFMHGHPILCMARTDLKPFGEPLDWVEAGHPAYALLKSDHGEYMRFERRDNVVVSFYPADGSKIQGLCDVSTACGTETAFRRVDERIRRHMAELGRKSTVAIAA